MLPPRRLGDPPYRPIVIRFGIDQALQLRIRGQLAHFRTPRPPERSRIGSQRRYAARPPLRTMSRDTVDARAPPLMWAFTMPRRRISVIEPRKALCHQRLGDYGECAITANARGFQHIGGNPGLLKCREVPEKDQNWNSFCSGFDVALACVCRSSLVAQQVSRVKEAATTGEESHVSVRGIPRRCRRVRAGKR